MLGTIKVMLIRSSVAIGLFTGLMGVAVNVWQMFAFRGLMGIFAGFSAAAIALVASQVPEDRLGYSLGWLSTGQLVGSLVGPVIGGLLADLTGSYRIPFFCTSATLFLATAAVWFIVQEQFTRPQKSGGREPWMRIGTREPRETGFASPRTSAPSAAMVGDWIKAVMGKLHSNSFSRMSIRSIGAKESPPISKKL